MSKDEVESKEAAPVEAENTDSEEKKTEVEKSEENLDEGQIDWEKTTQSAKPCPPSEDINKPRMREIAEQVFTAMHKANAANLEKKSEIASQQNIPTAAPVAEVSRPFYKKPRFWAVVAVVAAAGIIYYVTRPKTPLQDQEDQRERERARYQDELRHRAQQIQRYED